MRVAFDGRYLDGQHGGICSYSLNLLKALLREDPGLELLLIRRRKNRSLLGEEGAGRVEELYFPFPPNSPPTWMALGPLLARQRFDVFHSPFAVIPLRLDRPAVVTVHDVMWLVNPLFNSNSALLRLVAGTFYRSSLERAMASAGRILTVSDATRRAIVEHSPWHESKVRVTPNGIDTAKMAVLPRAVAFGTIDHLLPGDTPFVLTVGDASPHKNHLNAVRGFLLAFGDHPSYRMVLVRRFLRRDPAMRDLLRTREAREKVITLPHVTDEVLNALFHAARIFLHPSFYEGFGIPLLEAMAAGTPIVTSKTSSLPEVAGDAALLIDPADPTAIATALMALDRNEELRRTLIDRGRARLGQFTWEACARATLAAYRELVEHRGS